MASAPWLPGRPPNALDVERTMNGRMNYLGVIVSAGTAIDNSTTANPFAYVPRGAPATAGVDVPANYANTLAGRTLLVMASAAGHILASSAPLTTVGTPTVAAIATVPPAVGTIPGPKVQAEERVPFIMSATDGWLQFIPTTGSANLWVWELT